ncbi:uncharacterized protein LOC105161158 isoform X2 [Sesamum indicum]|uniref:Uncharacterized protein LOC105161158 isoform X2 n=1 Tax=Sesamum indicum TaxID=4182 RepID=A0A6I9T0T2_SESIN|nr:uncharacterized protein LOC105161158 isoform X2 [Sesamum indicum]
MGNMFGWWECCAASCCERVYEEFLEDPEPFSLPSPLPQWPKGKGFATGKICLGEIEVVKITEFEKIWSCSSLSRKANAVAFYKPVGIPDGYSSLGHYCQPSDRKLRGYVLVAKCISSDESQGSKSVSPALTKPLNYTLVWSSHSHGNEYGYIWLPNPPEGYKPTGFVVTTEPEEPDLEEVRCVREDLTESCEVNEVIFERNSVFPKGRIYVGNTRPCRRGMLCRGVPVGTFYCSQDEDSENDMSIACLKNLDSSLLAMPNLDQVHALIKHYGPTVYLHPDEAFLPSSVSWFFENGALLYKDGRDKGLAIDSKGSNLPGGGRNDGQFWLDLPVDNNRSDHVKSGSMKTAELYVHVKPASGGTFTDIAMWIFCPFNGPSTIKAGAFNYTFSRIGQHVGDWEHYTLRLSNFEGELWSVYFSEHSGGEWLDASALEFIDGNKPIIYASKSGHASFPHEGCYIQGSTKLGIGARNDCAKSNYSIDSSTKYQVIAAEYLGDEIEEPHWLQYMREWGPTVVYDSRSELDKILKHLPFFVRFSLENLIELFPTELYGEEGPTGPKEKDNWLGDERC